MRIAVITPSWRTPTKWLQQCLDSVAGQSLKATHFLVLESEIPHGLRFAPDVHVLRTQGAHHDYGNVARAIGSISAIGHRFDAIAYLDSDNWFEPNHLELLVELCKTKVAAVGSAGRQWRDLEGNLLGPCAEVDGETFVDTSCLYLTRDAFSLVAAWYAMPEYCANIGDRYFWHQVIESKLARAHQPIPTVNYRTQFRAHYEHMGLQAPRCAKEAIVVASKPSEKSRDVTVSLCMIVRNEQSNLPEAIQPIADLVDEILVVDCGSTDKTRIVAASLGARLVDHKWEDSFAAARNEWFQYARGDWIFWLDADDRLDATNVCRLKKLFATLSDENAVYLMTQRSATEDPGQPEQLVDHARLFKKIPGLRWRYRVHEQILGPLQEFGAQAYRTDIVIEHVGYRSRELIRPKNERNQRLLALDRQEHPHDSFILFNLATAAGGEGRHQIAISMLEQCLATAPAGISFIPKAHALLAEILRAGGHLHRAKTQIARGLESFPDDPELLYSGAMIFIELLEYDNAKPYLERIVALPARCNLSGVADGVSTYLARHQLALLERRAKRWVEAEKQWLEVTRLRPNFGPAYIALVELYFRDSRTEDAMSVLDSLTQNKETVVIAEVVRARALTIKRQLDEACKVFERVIALNPVALWPKLVYCEMLIRENLDNEKVKSLLQQIIETDPNQSAACHRLVRLQGARPD